MDSEVLPEKSPAKVLLIAIASVIVIAALAGGYFWRKNYRTETAPTPPIPPKTEEVSLGGQIYKQVQNPTEKLPETNPFETKTNPFTDIYKNPFE